MNNHRPRFETDDVAELAVHARELERAAARLVGDCRRTDRVDHLTESLAHARAAAETLDRWLAGARHD